MNGVVGNNNKSYSNTKSTATSRTATSDNDNATTTTTTLSILRSSGVKDEIKCNLNNTTLRDLKVLISQSNVLGYIPIQQQRIFHYGRELKTLGRTLITLGVGRFSNTATTNKAKSQPKIIIHVHVIPLQALHNASLTVNDASIATTTTTPANNQYLLHHPTRQRARTTAVTVTNTNTTANTNNTNNNTEIVDLYSDHDDDDDDDDDDCCIVVSNNTSVVANNMSTTTTTTTTTSTRNAPVPNQSNKRRRT